MWLEDEELGLESADSEPDAELREFMETPVIEQFPNCPALVVSPGERVADVVQLMRMRHSGAALIMEDEALCGIFTDRDLLTAVKFPPETPVSKLMTHGVEAIPSQAETAFLFRNFAVWGYRHSPISKNGDLAGLVSAGMLLSAVKEKLSRHIIFNEPMCEALKGVAELRFNLKVRPEDTLRNAVEKMATFSGGAVRVVDEDLRLVGIVSERDLTKILTGQATLESPLYEVMTTDVITAQVQAPIRTAMEIMVDNGIRHLPLVDADDRIVDRDLTDKLAGICVLRDGLHLMVEYYHQIHCLPPRPCQTYAGGEG